MSDSIAWQKAHYKEPYEMFDIKAVDKKQKELGRMLTKEEFDSFVFGCRQFGEKKGVVLKAISEVV
jgi:hypothetical protein